MKPIYPWSTWFAKPRLTLTRGRDFSCSPRSMAQQFRNHASSVGIRIRVVEQGKTLDVFLYQPNGKKRRNGK